MRRKMPIALAIVVGIAYGILARIYLERSGLVSVTYLFLLPAGIAAIPVLLGVPTLLRDRPWMRIYLGSIAIPTATILGFFLVAYAFDLEDLLCILIMGTPFLVVSMLIVFVVLISKMKREREHGVALCLVLLPLVAGPVESWIENREAVREVVSTIEIAASPEAVWNNVIRVSEIARHEAPTTWLDRIGIPRPVEATLDGEGFGALRVGRFDDGLRFVERVTAWDLHRHIRFRVEIDRATLRDRVFDQHVLESGSADILSAGYTLTPLGDGRVRLELSSAYRLETKLNWYAGWWGDLIVRDFQERLLEVVKRRLEG